MAADIEDLLATRYSELIRSRLQLDLASEMCRTLLEPWPNRGSSGVCASTTRLTGCAERSEYHTPPVAGGTKEVGCKGECPVEGGHKGTDPLNRGSVGEFPLAPCSSPDLAIDMEGLEEILTKARKVREMQIKLERKQSKDKEDPLKPVKGETSKTTVKKSMQKASQVYSQQSEQRKPRSAATQSVPRSSQSRVQSSKKTPGGTHLKSKSCYSQLHSIKKISKGLSDASQRKSSAPVEGKGMEGGAGGNEKGRTRPEWRSVVPDNLVQSEVDEVPGVSRLPQGKSSQVPACKDTGLAEKEDKMKGHFRISEHGRNIDMPFKYHRLKEAAARVTAELKAQQSASPYEEGFVAKLSQLEDMDQLSTINADLYIQLVLFRENCQTLQAQIAQYIPKKVTEESQRGQKHLPSPERESVRLRFEELEKQWAKLSRRGSTSSVQWRWSAPWDSRVSRQHWQQPKPLIYTTVKEWLEYSQLKNEVAQLEWEAKFLKACLTVIPPKLNHSTSDRSHIHAIQSVYHLFGITQPSFVLMPDSST